jgi:DNA-binding transcriptional regulator YiaG
MKDLQLLIEIGVPPARIAAHLGVSRAAVHYWRAGVHQPAGENALKLQALLAQIRARLCPPPLTGC